MSRLSIRRAHALTAAEARARVEHAAARIAERFGARCEWQGDVLAIEHSSVTGAVTLKPREISIDAELKFPLSLLRGRAESELTRILDDELRA